MVNTESCVHRGSLGKLLCGEEAPDPEWKPACNLHLHLLLATQSRIVHSVRPPVVLIASCRQVCVWAPSEVPSPCLLHSNMWPCPRPAGCSSADTVCSWRCLWRWGIGPSWSLRSTCYFYHHKYMWATTPLSWSLVNPAHSISTEGESRGYTGESQGPPRLHQVSSRLRQLHVTLDTFRRKISSSGNCHTSTLSHSYPLTYSVSPIHHELPFKRATRNTQPSTNSMVRCLFCPDQRMGTPGTPGAGAPLPAAESGWAGFISTERTPFACALTYISSSSLRFDSLKVNNRVRDALVV